MKDKIIEIIDKRYEVYKEYSDFYKEFEKEYEEKRKDILSELKDKENVTPRDYLELAYNDVIYRQFYRDDINNLACKYVVTCDDALMLGIELEEKHKDLYELLKPQVKKNFFVIKKGKAEPKDKEFIEKSKEELKKNYLDAWLNNFKK